MGEIRETITEVKVLTNPKEHYFFGYYDLQPYDSKDEKHLCHRVQFTDRLPTIDDVCELGYIELSTGEFVKVAETTAWNFQQGALLQWYRDDEHIAYNVRTESGFGTAIHNIVTGEKRILPKAAANISQDGKYGLCLNMSRIYDFRPGYGYSDVPDVYKDINAPAEDGVFLMNMETGETKQIISYADIIKQFPQEPYTSCKLVINHITFNPSGNRFLFLLRNFFKEGVSWETQLITSDLDGNMCRLSEYTYNSHYHWKNDEQILIVTSHGGTQHRDNLCLRDDFNGETIVYDEPEFHVDIHCLYSPNRKYILGDEYPDERRYRPLYLYEVDKKQMQLLLWAYDTSAFMDVRCDLHARWNRKGNRISFDSNYTGGRCICEMDLSSIVEY